jgi:hypothetical protein
MLTIPEEMPHGPSGTHPRTVIRGQPLRIWPAARTKIGSGVQIMGERVFPRGPSPLVARSIRILIEEDVLINGGVQIHPDKSCHEKGKLVTGRGPTIAGGMRVT